MFALVYRIKKNLIESLVNNLDSTRVDQRIKPILDYVKHLTLTPSRMVEADAQGDDETVQTETVGWFFVCLKKRPDDGGFWFTSDCLMTGVFKVATR